MNELIKMNEMKTRIEEAAREYVKNEQGINSEICHAVGNINKLEKLISHFEEVFIAGAEFMQGEIKALEEKLKVAVEFVDKYAGRGDIEARMILENIKAK
jgi:hypothetical protein